MNNKLKIISRSIEDFIDETELHEKDVELLNKIISALKSIKVESNTKILSNCRLDEIKIKGGKSKISYHFEYSTSKQNYHFLTDTKDIENLDLQPGGLYHIHTVHSNNGWKWVKVELLGGANDFF